MWGYLSESSKLRRVILHSRHRVLQLCVLLWHFSLCFVHFKLSIFRNILMVPLHQT